MSNISASNIDQVLKKDFLPSLFSETVKLTQISNEVIQFFLLSLQKVPRKRGIRILSALSCLQPEFKVIDDSLS
jgi:hypothetical protein